MCSVGGSPLRAAKHVMAFPKVRISSQQIEDIPLGDLYNSRDSRQRLVHLTFGLAIPLVDCRGTASPDRIPNAATLTLPP